MEDETVPNHFDGILYWLDGVAYGSYGAKLHLIECGYSLNDAIEILRLLQKQYFDKLRNPN